MIAVYLFPSMQCALHEVLKNVPMQYRREERANTIPLSGWK